MHWKTEKKLEGQLSLLLRPSSPCFWRNRFHGKRNKKKGKEISEQQSSPRHRRVCEIMENIPLNDFEESLSKKTSGFASVEEPKAVLSALWRIFACTLKWLYHTHWKKQKRQDRIKSVTLKWKIKHHINNNCSKNSPSPNRPIVQNKIIDCLFTAANVATNAGFQCSCQGWFTINTASVFFFKQTVG